MLFNPSPEGFGGLKGSPRSRPPDKLYLPKGGVTNAWRAAEIPFASSRSRFSGAQKAGLAYQKRVGKFLDGARGQWTLDPSPWFAYCDSGGKRRYCQPDFLLRNDVSKCLVIIEVKITWTPAAWWQLRRLYEPVLSVVYPGWTIIPLVISRSYDPALPREEVPTFCSEVTAAVPNLFNLLIVR